MVGLGAAMLLIITALLVGPAFAVSATRQRRTLALAASNGASTAVLRRTVLAQALVLGRHLGPGRDRARGRSPPRCVLALVRGDGDFSPTVPLDIRWGLLAGIALCALGEHAGRGARARPAPRPARHRRRDARPERLARGRACSSWRRASCSPCSGAFAVLGSTGAGGLPSVTGLLGIQDGAEYAVTIGAVVLILGTLFLVPVILAGVGRLGSHLPTTLRMAARDLARHRSRSAPSVAAVLAAVAGLTFGLTGLASDTEQSRREYQPQTLPGEAVVNLCGPARRRRSTRCGPRRPGLAVHRERGLRHRGPVDERRRHHADRALPGRLPQRRPAGLHPGAHRAGRRVVRRGGRSLPRRRGRRDAGELRAGREPVHVRRYVLHGQRPDPAAARRRDRPSPRARRAAEADAVRAGAVVSPRRCRRARPAARRSRIARGTSRRRPHRHRAGRPQVQVEQQVDLPVVELPRTQETEGRMLNASLAARRRQRRDEGLADAHGEPHRPRPVGRSHHRRRRPRSCSRPLGDELQVSVERGFSRDDAIIVAVLLGVFALLILVITLTSTALTLAEQQTDQATLAALGATAAPGGSWREPRPSCSRRSGCVLGVAVGLVPGIAIARPLTSNGWTHHGPPGRRADDPGHPVAVPARRRAWLVPLVAGAIAWAGIRKAPQVTRRTT